MFTMSFSSFYLYGVSAFFYKSYAFLAVFIPIIAKIEKPEAIKNLDSIIDVFHGILIARGDLGVEMPLAKLPGLQKLIIEKPTLLRRYHFFIITFQIN